MPNNTTKFNNLIFPEINFSEVKTSWVHKLNKDGLILELSRRNLISTGTVVELKNRLLNYLKGESLESDFLTINSLTFFGNPINNNKKIEMNDNNKRPYFKPNKFSGSISDNIDSFLKQYNRAALINGWSDEDKTLFIAAFLEGPALIFFDNIQDEISDIKWVNLEENLRKEFEPIAQTEMIRLILEKRKQLEDEPTVAYINEAESLCRRIDKNMSQEEIVRNIMKGLRPNIARYIGILGNKNLNELKENVRKYEMIEFMITGHTVQTPSQFKNDIIQNQLNQIDNPIVEENKISNEIKELKQIIQKSLFMSEKQKQNNINHTNKKCDICGLNNHNTNNCFKKPNYGYIKCQLCNTPGHTAINCKKTNENKKQCSICNLKNHDTKDCYYKDGNIIKCQLCEKIGHTAKTCFKINFDSKNLN